MMDFMPESDGNILGVRATGTLTEDDYRNVLMPRLDTLIGRFGKVRVLFFMDDRFRGWSLAAAWANTALDVKHRRDLERIAIVGAPAWEELCVKVASCLMKGEMATFPAERLQDAWSWLRRA